METFDTVIIGGGASGLMLYKLLCGNNVIIEAGDRVGKKLLATGNGKCNLSNVSLSADKYNAPDFVKPVIDKFGFDWIVETFKKIGVLTKTVDGRLYPYSECASTVLNALRRGVNACVGYTATEIKKDKNGYIVYMQGNCQKQVFCKNVVLASGSKASFGIDSVNLFCAMGHTAKPFKPSLCPIKVLPTEIKGLGGVRAKAVLKCGEIAEKGELMFKDGGIVSGIAAFNVASYIARGVYPDLSIDFMPEYTISDVEKLSIEPDGIFHARLSELIRQRAVGKSIGETIKNFKVTCLGLCDMNSAQVASGGLSLSEFDVDLQSRLHKGMYAIGEALDVDGICGGYNLSWAWASAGKVAQKINFDRRL